MKRHGYLFEKVIDLDNLRLAVKNAARGKTKFKQVRKFFQENKDDCLLLELQKTLKEGKFKTSKYERVTKYEGKKEREIYKLPFYPDRIVQHAILQITSKYFLDHFSLHSYSSVRGRGIHKCFHDVKRVLKKFPVETKYCLKVDVTKFYNSINHTTLKSKLSKIFKDKKLLNLLFEIVDSFSTKEDTGVPIGNYLSQYFGNLYLGELDRILESKSFKFFRYMDDIVLLDRSKEKLRSLLNLIGESFSNLKLKLKRNFQIFKTTLRPLDFVGYRYFGKCELVRKEISKNAKKCTNKSKPSYLGWFLHSKQYNFIVSYLL